jgi:hypothetical protein
VLRDEIDQAFVLAREADAPDRSVTISVLLAAMALSMSMRFG